MGYYVINNLIKERINNMSKEKMKETINTIKSVDSMKAVKVAFDLSESLQDSVSKVMQVVSLVDNNMKELATKVLKLERALDLYETDMTKLDKRIEELETKEYERDLNERPSN